MTARPAPASEPCRARRAAALALLLAGWALSSCKSESSGASGAAGGGPAPGSKGPEPALTATGAGGSSAPHGGLAPRAITPSSTPNCRATRVSGSVQLGSAALASGDLVGGGDWLDLGPGASLALKHTQTAREVELRGPAHVLACRGGREQFLISQGTLSTSSGLGARPGAEVLIATPLGAIRYGDAALDVEVSAARLRVSARRGYAWLLPENAVPGFHNPLRGPDGRVELRSGPVDPRARVEACKAAAERAESSARRVTTPASGDPQSLGERAASNARDRAAARSACAMAAAALGLVKDPALGRSLSSELARWDGLWQAAPRSRAARD